MFYVTIMRFSKGFSLVFGLTIILPLGDVFFLYVANLILQYTILKLYKLIFIYKDEAFYNFLIFLVRFC